MAEKVNSSSEETDALKRSYIKKSNPIRAGKTKGEGKVYGKKENPPLQQQGEWDSSDPHLQEEVNKTKKLDKNLTSTFKLPERGYRGSRNPSWG